MLTWICTISGFPYCNTKVKNNFSNTCIFWKQNSEGCSNALSWLIGMLNKSSEDNSLAKMEGWTSCLSYSYYGFQFSGAASSLVYSVSWSWGGLDSLGRGKEVTISWKMYNNNFSCFKTLFAVQLHVWECGMLLLFFFIFFSFFLDIIQKGNTIWSNRRLQKVNTCHS